MLKTGIVMLATALTLAIFNPWPAGTERIGYLIIMTLIITGSSLVIIAPTPHGQRRVAFEQKLHPKDNDDAEG